MTEISISPGNMKLGSIPSISLPPERTCINKPCESQCYARRMEAYRPGVRLAWERNWRALQEGSYMAQVHNWLEKNQPHYFRWHVGGDIPNQEYLNDMVHIAALFQKTKFLAFTKMYNLRYEAVVASDNLTVLISMWPGHDAPKGVIVNLLPKAWMYDKNNVDIRIPPNALQCGGNCVQCNAGNNSCWLLKFAAVPHVVFNKH